MDLKLTDKIALVTGTGSQVGFGRCIATTLAQEGCHIISVDIDIEGAEKTAGQVRALGRRAIALKTDNTKRAEVDAATDKALEEFGKIDILVNCAGAASGLRPFVESTEEDWNMDMDINFKGTMRFTQSVLPHMLERKYGKIVNFSTHAAHQATGLAGAGPYCAAKAAMEMLSKTLVGEVGSQGININIIAPGPGATNFHRASGAPSEMVDLVDNLAKEGKATTPEDIANSVAFLVSDVSNKITGQVLEVSNVSGPGG